MELLGDVGHVESHFGSVGGSVSVLFKIGAWFAPNIPKARKSFWMHSMELLGDMGHVQYRFGSFGDSVSFDARKVHGLRQVYQRLRNHFRCTRWYY